MAGSVGTKISPIAPIQTDSGNFPVQRRLPEAAAASWPNNPVGNMGSPLVVTSGYALESTAISSAVKIAGFSNEPFHALAVAGVGGVGSTYGSVPNQTSAKIIITGSPPQDGNIGVDLAVGDTLFLGWTDGAHTLAVTDPGTIYGITRDATSGLWFVDTTITVAGSGAIIEVVQLYDAVGTVGGRVIFRVCSANRYFSV